MPPVVAAAMLPFYEWRVIRPRRLSFPDDHVRVRQLSKLDMRRAW